jgi:transcriptional regulator with XRE-family HTH domain
MGIGEKIRAAREKQSLSGRELAKRAQISPSFLSDIEKGRTKPSLDTLTAICHALGIGVATLLDETKQSTPKISLIPDQILIPILHPSFLACAGDGHNLHGVTMEASEHIPLPEKDLGTIGEAPIFGVRVEGTSMEAADIKDGSVAIINPNQEIRYGDPCLVCFGIDEAAIKFVYPQPGGGLRIESADPSYKKHQFTKEEVEGGLVRVVGPVVATVWVGKPKRGI